MYISRRGEPLLHVAQRLIHLGINMQISMNVRVGTVDIMLVVTEGDASTNLLLFHVSAVLDGVEDIVLLLHVSLVNNMHLFDGLLKLIYFTNTCTNFHIQEFFQPLG